MRFAYLFAMLDAFSLSQLYSENCLKTSF